jgi:hypothetical protein
MVRDYSVILASESSFATKDILTSLNQHAFPRIRGRLITATDSTRKHIFYDDLSQMALPTVQARANQLVYSVMTDSIISDYVYRIAAALTASWRLRALAGQIKEQAHLGTELEKQALDDLEFLVTSPELSAAALAAKAKLEEGPDTSPKIYLALDLNPSTYNAQDNSVKPYLGANEDGAAILWIGPYSIAVDVHRGDTPSVLMYNLLAALRAYQMRNPPPASLANIIIGPNEGPLVSGTRTIEVTNAVGQKAYVSGSAFINVGWIGFHVYQRDPQIEAMYCTLELRNSQGEEGIDGIVYGSTHLDYTKLTKKGPYSVLVDFKNDGKAGKPNPERQNGGVSSNFSDTFFFTVGEKPPAVGSDYPSGGKTAQNGMLRYQVSSVVANASLQDVAPQPRSIVIPAGSTALDVVRLIAQDMDSVAFYHKVLPAVRSPVPIQVMGSPLHAPGLEIVPYRPSGFEDKIVFDVLEVPSDVHFGVLPPNLVTNGAFDNQAKSIVVNVKFVAGQASKLSPLSTLQGRARAVDHTMSQQMQTAFNDVRFYNRGLF